MDIVIVIKGLGVLFVLIGVAYLLKPKVLKTLMSFFKKGKRIYVAGLIRFALAVVFLLAATQCRKPTIIGAFGVLFLLSGLLIFVLGPPTIRRIFDWYEKQPTLLYRIIASIVIVVGAIIIFSA
ncbi:MAG: hypothetical protein A2Z25_14500 [Planctomycetes bacterium RBG_16_55_9]|nr:MAG: hypothetical protein A2Z25_14500 [Planctomycetes bacterium RBG_16_55_9]